MVPRRKRNQNRNQGGLQHSADREIEEQGLDIVGNLEGCDAIAGTEMAGRKLFSNQPKYPTGQSAGCNKQGGFGDTGTRRGGHSMASGTDTRG